MRARSFLAGVFLFLSAAVHATPQLRNATDMWFNVSESGWGLNLIHQGDTLFGTLFVYGPDGQPTWYVASGLVGSGTSYSGALYATTGSWFGAAFNAGSVTRRQVGTMTVDVREGVAIVDYTVDGVHVTKQVTRFSFRPIDLLGLYRAYVYQPAAGGLPEVRRDLERFSVTDDGARVAIDTSSDSASDCSYTGPHGQDGQIASAGGNYACGFNGSSGTGSWSMRVDPSPSGFVGSFSGASVGVTSGRIAAALNGTPRLEGTGWRNGMWYVPSESGWGLNVIEQGSGIFATLFVYDAQGKPHWYVASDLQQTIATTDGTTTNTGTLYEATGPYFGAASFNPGSVTRRAVGSMSFQVRSPGSAVLTYTVDGVPVTKNVSSFTFARNDPSGTYIGQITGDNGHDPADITIADQNGSFTMRIKGMFGGSTCDYTGSSQQVGEAINASGTLQCGGTSSATFVLKNLMVSFDGVTGRVELSNVTGFVQEGLKAFNFAGARTNAS